MAENADPKSAESSIEAVHVGRQAILNRSLVSKAYELFYRTASTAPPGDPAAPLGWASLSGVAALGLTRAARDSRVFLDVTPQCLSQPQPLPLDPKLVVLQLRDYGENTDELAKAVAKRKAEGFRIALVDLEFNSSVKPLSDLANYLKFNVQQLGVDGLKKQVKLAGGKKRTLVATDIATTKEFKRCVTAGCDLFQGPFLFQPRPSSAKKVPASLTTLTQLTALLRDPHVDYAEIEALVKTDPALAVGILKLLSSAAFGLSKEVSSIAHAVSLLGLHEFEKWATVASLSASSKRPGEMSLVALTRARAAEILAVATGEVDPDEAFTVGMISSLDALFEQSMEELLQQLPVSAVVREALTEGKSPAGLILAAVKGREEASLDSGNFDAALVNRAWFEALAWAENALHSVGSEKK